MKSVGWPWPLLTDGEAALTAWASGLVMREVAAFFGHRKRPPQGILPQARETAMGLVADLRVPVRFVQIRPDNVDSLRGAAAMLCLARGPR